MESIGVIESCYRDKFGTPRQPGLAPSSWAKLRLHPKWQPENSLQGLERFSHLWIIFLFHQNTNLRFHAKVHPPRLNGETIGVFATRSPHRPNPIGLSLVKIEKIEDGDIYLSGIDLIDGTPVLDIKPYLPSVEAIQEAQEGWSAEASRERFEIRWTLEQLQTLKAWSLRIAQPALQTMIEETLAMDPRPRVYKDPLAGHRTSHAVRFFDGDIHFVVNENKSVSVLEIRFESGD